ncbi:MAG: NAD(P)H-nitrite reductase large subunit [Rhodothermales bacterium]|jgi:NAD(P)H-nitrite reductase large subunit
MYIYMGDLRYQDTKPYADDFWAKNRIGLVQGFATRIDGAAKTLELASGERIAFDKLLIATGSRPNRFGWPGEHAIGVQGLYGLDDLALMEENTDGIGQAVVVGGGLIGVEMAEMLSARGIAVTFMVREQHYMDYLLSESESGLMEAAIRAHGVNLELGASLDHIAVDEEGRAKGVVLQDGREFPAQFVGLAVGLHPNVQLARDSGVEVGAGVLINNSFQTSMPDVFAAGDCAEFKTPAPGQRPIEQLWYTGRSHGRQVANGLLGTPEAYSRPLFFNSAKAFDLEYQTYGTVPPEPAPDQDEIVCGDGQRQVRIVFEQEARAVVGVNALGIRLRQNVWSHWIRNGFTVDAVIAEFHRGVFDPEFTPAIEVVA